MKEIVLTDKVYEIKCPYNHMKCLYRTRLMDECVKVFCPHCGTSMIKKKLRTVGTHNIQVDSIESE